VHAQLRLDLLLEGKAGVPGGADGLLAGLGSRWLGLEARRPLVEQGTQGSLGGRGLDHSQVRVFPVS